MSGPDIVLGLIGAIDVAVRYGVAFVKTCSAYRHADDNVSQLVVRVELCWKQTEMQLRFLRQIWTELDHEHQALQEETLYILIKVLSTADSRLQSLHKQFVSGELTTTLATLKIGKRGKTRYALIHDCLHQAIGEVEAWQRRFDPSWYLIMRIASRGIDTELQDTNATSIKPLNVATAIRKSISTTPGDVHVTLPESELVTANIDDISLATAKVMFRANSNQPLILDNVSCPSIEEYQQRRKVMRDLARLLRNVEPASFCLMKCAGLIPRPNNNQYTLVFRVPENLCDPRSLRSHLLASQDRHSLSDRFQLARQLATAVCSIHTLGFVHKSIRPENILLFRDQVSDLGSAFLVGFDMMRPEDGRTQLAGATDWEKNLYRHPQRQGSSLQAAYIMQHDIYSLGVCLLEVGLWTSFFKYIEGAPQPAEAAEYTLDIGPHQQADDPDFASTVKEELVRLATSVLPIKMGAKYTKVVRTCLTCLDDDCEDFGEESEFLDEDGVRVAVRYIDKILLQLNEISV